MTTTYRSKIDVWLAALVAVGTTISLTACLWVAWAAPTGWFGISAASGLLGVALPLWVLWSTDYTVGNGTLRIRSGPFRRCIPLADITAVEHSRDPRSNPALSLDRLAIRFGTDKRVLVSPREPAVFLGELRRQCPTANVCVR